VSQLALAGNTAPPKFSKKELLGLERYDAMLTAIASARKSMNHRGCASATTSACNRNRIVLN
jgi:hypothetical protein